jgi:hypothetical protein
VPLGSNIPIPEFSQQGQRDIREALNWTPDEIVAVAFGGLAKLRKCLKSNRDLVERAIQDGRLHRVAIIGGGSSEQQFKIATEVYGDVPPWLSCAGLLPEKSVADVLIASDFALTGYAPEHFGKSSTIAAFCDAGLPIATPQAREGLSHDSTPIFDGASKHFPGKLRDENARKARQLASRQIHSWSGIAGQIREILNR